MFVVCVHVQVKPESRDAFLAACLDNASHSIQEAGCLRFDVLQQQDDATRFVLYEAYRDVAAADAHKTTAHYARWRDAVAPWMAAPRQGVKYTSQFPTDVRQWAALPKPGA